MKGITIYDLSEIGKSAVFKHRFTMCYRTIHNSVGVYLLYKCIILMRSMMFSSVLEGFGGVFQKVDRLEKFDRVMCFSLKKGNNACISKIFY